MTLQTSRHLANPVGLQQVVTKMHDVLKVTESPKPLTLQHKKPVTEINDIFTLEIFRVENVKEKEKQT